MHSGALSLWAAGALTVILGVLILRGRMCFSALPVIHPPDRDEPKALPDCMVVIPARDEEATIGRAVRSLPPDTVIVVDDHSADKTAAKAREAGAGVVTAPDLPKNGIGKANACAFGAETLVSRWVLFTDADTWFEPGFLNAAVATAEASNLALLSIDLEPVYEGIVENALVPYARALAFAGFSMARRRSALLRSQCLLALREPYKFMGGHRAVVTQIAEDVRLTRLAERHRMPLAIARAPQLGHIRLYQGYRGIRRGIRRHALRFVLVNPLIGATIMIAALAGALWLPALIWLIAAKHWIAAALFALAPSAILASWYRNWMGVLYAPLALYWILPVLAGGFFAAVLGRPVRWKRRVVSAVT